MIREKIITGLFFTIVGGLVIEAFPEIIQQSVKSESSLGSAKTRPSLDDKAKEFPNESNQVTDVINWGKDIFHDRSNVYNSWFQLTGITRFDNGYKAIVNGQIVHELSMVRGFIVKTITSNKVVLARDQYRVILKLGR